MNIETLQESTREISSPAASAQASNDALELWGGIECTVNRVGDEFFCQLSRSGHIERSSDLDLLASLGLSAIRYPILWEKCAPHGFDSIDWSWPDARLNQLRELKIKPVVGLVHHGGGPRSTSLVDAEFAPGLARWAGLVAQRYPWIHAYTPVNEPVTTARFSTLYGFWFPHARDDRAFARAMVNQCRATVLSMREIRRFNPDALLIQNDDIGEVYSTPAMEYQAKFENARRWLSFDLLCGRVVAGHTMHHYLRWYGISDEELDWFAANPCPPDVIGLDHYVTSNRFLDEHVEAYPRQARGSNGQHEYVDVEAVRVDLPRLASVRDLLRETWQRYQKPVAITEAHLGCTREEQMRWLQEVWQNAQQARREGIPVQAVTAWSLLGSHDCDSMLTREGSHYEPGAFDTRAPSPRETALASMTRALGRGEKFSHPVLAQPGWWRREGRVLFDSPGVAQAREKTYARISPEASSTCRLGAPQVLEARQLAPAPSNHTLQFFVKRARPHAPRPVLIIGAYGALGRAFSYVCHSRGLVARPLSRFECDILQPDSICAALDEHLPWAVVNAAGLARVDQAEGNHAACFELNTHAAIDLARSCAERGLPLVNFSSHLVFDGSQDGAYAEEDQPRPLSVYGESKRAMEQGTLEVHPGALIVRAGPLFGPWDGHNFVSRTLLALERGEQVRAPHDALISPTYVPYLAHATLDLLLDKTCGLWHGANEGEVSWHELALEAARRARIRTSKLIAIPAHEMNTKAPRPRNGALHSSRAWIMPPLSEALDRFERERAK